MKRRQPPSNENTPELPGLAKEPDSKKSQTQFERLATSALARHDQEQEQVLGLRPLILCGLPIRRQPQPYYMRKSGPYTVELISAPQLGVPYGQDRLIPIFLATLFSATGCPEDNRVQFLYARDILRLFDLPFDGKTYQRIKDGFTRWKKTLLSISRKITTKKGKAGEESQAMCLLPQSRLWFQEQEEADDIPNEIWLAPSWAEEIRQHPIPVDLQSVRALASCPGALDFYQWQAWRSFSITSETHVSLMGETGLVAQLGCVEGQPAKELRRLISRWQDLIRIHWKDCPNSLSRDGKTFVLQPAKALGHLQANRFLLSLIRGYKDPSR